MANIPEDTDEVNDSKLNFYQNNDIVNIPFLPKAEVIDNLIEAKEQISSEDLE